MTNTLSIGILGTGFSAVHVRCLLGIEEVTVRAVCGTSQAKAQTFIEKTGASQAQAFGDFDAMLAQTKLDALYVCLPPNAHSGQVEKAAGRGLHLFLEKPIAFDLAHAEVQMEAIEKAGVVSMVGYHNRFYQSVEVFKALISSGEAGRPTQFQGRFWCNMIGPDWWRSESGSPGQVYEQVIHIYDMALNLFGEPEMVCAFTDNLAHRHMADYAIEDTSAAIIRFKNGALASIVGSNAAIPGQFSGDYRAVCEKAVFDFRSAGNEPSALPQAVIYQYPAESVTTRQFIENRNPYLVENQEFIAAIRGEAVSRVPVSAGVAGIRLVSAVLESARKNGQPVRI